MARASIGRAAGHFGAPAGARTATRLSRRAAARRGGTWQDRRLRRAGGARFAAQTAGAVCDRFRRPRQCWRAGTSAARRRQAVVQIGQAGELRRRDRLQRRGKCRRTGAAARDRSASSIPPPASGSARAAPRCRARLLDRPVEHLRLVLRLIQIQPGAAGQQEGGDRERSDHVLPSGPMAMTFQRAQPGAAGARVALRFRGAGAQRPRGQQAEIRAPRGRQAARVVARRRRRAARSLAS